jgi:endonuclease/exonuclease/phosphatase (EEP) superfamily protein YafD
MPSPRRPIAGRPVPITVIAEQVHALAALGEDAEQRVANGDGLDVMVLTLQVHAAVHQVETLAAADRP